MQIKAIPAHNPTRKNTRPFARGAGALAALTLVFTLSTAGNASALPGGANIDEWVYSNGGLECHLQAQAGTYSNTVALRRIWKNGTTDCFGPAPMPEKLRGRIYVVNKTHSLLDPEPWKNTVGCYPTWVDCADSTALGECRPAWSCSYTSEEDDDALPQQTYRLTGWFWVYASDHTDRWYSYPSGCSPDRSGPWRLFCQINSSDFGTN